MRPFSDYIWVIVTCVHANLLKEVIPKTWSISGITLGLVLSSKCGCIARETSRVQVRIRPETRRRIVFLILVKTCLAFFNEVVVHFDMSFTYLYYVYRHLGFWFCLGFYATDIFQVLIPMYMMVKPSYCWFLILALIVDNY